MVTNLVNAGGDKMVQHLFEGEVVLALSAIAASCKGIDSQLYVCECKDICTLTLVFSQQQYVLGKEGHEAQLFELAKEAALALAHVKPC